MCSEIDFTFRKQNKGEDCNAYLKARRIDFVDKLTQLPIKFFDLKKDDIPKGLLKTVTVKNYQKFVYSAFSFVPRYFLRVAEMSLFSKPLRELKLSEWVHGVERDLTGHCTQESKDAVERLKLWQESVKDMFESDFVMETVINGNKMAQWFLEKRINKKYNDKIILAQAQVELAKQMAEAAKSQNAPVNVTFTMG